jgi:hypothetical protein
MNDTLIKFQGGQCGAMACGSKNPVTAMMAQMILSGPEFMVAQVQGHADVAPQSVGKAGLSSGSIGIA